MGAKILIIDHNDSFTYNLVGLFEEADTPVSQVDVWSVDKLSAIDLSLVWEYDCLVLSPGPGLPHDYPEVTHLLDIVLGENKLKILPVLGICLGLHTLVTYYGGTLYNLKKIQHGRQVELCLQHYPMAGEADSVASDTDRVPGKAGTADTAGIHISKDLNSPIKVGLYHSWGVTIAPENNPDPQVEQTGVDLNRCFLENIQKGIPSDLEITAVACPGQSGYSYREDAISAPVVMGIRHRTLPIIGLQFHPESYMTPDGAGLIRNWLEFILEIKRLQIK